MKTQAGRWSVIALTVFFTLALTLPAMSQESGTAPVQEKSSTASTPAAESASQAHFTAGQKATVEGVVVKRDADSFTMRDLSGSIVNVRLSSNTEVKERKSNPFRRAKNYGVTQLLRGLDVEVKGHGGNDGALMADEIRFTKDDLRLASTMDARVTPVETQVSANEVRLGQTEENAQKLSGQVSELSAVSNAARGGAKAAQETADTALESAKTANEEAKGAKAGVRAANERIAALDDYDTKQEVTVNFKAGSADLSAQAKEELDKLAESAKNEKGFIIEVAGFASSDGNLAFNQALSQRRADAVIQYMAENHTIPLRRFITPFGYGVKMPVADNKTHEGRVQNRRVEVRILVSKGLVSSSSPTVAMK